MLRMTVLSTVLLASSAVAGPQAATTASAPPASPATAPQAPAADPSSTCAYLTVSQGEIPESRDIFDATITQIVATAPRRAAGTGIRSNRARTC